MQARLQEAALHLSLLNPDAFGRAAGQRGSVRLAAAAGILAVEAYHMGMARSSLYRMGEDAWNAANAVSDARDKIDGSGRQGPRHPIGGQGQYRSIDPGCDRTHQDTVRSASDRLSDRSVRRQQGRI
ncbi:hypothetical protein MES4922_220025 [Mesorhizobium ventifaucium]|uniref:Uncharacterized protein n=1 Tax=Mesorhizobium ventifaucium TaxID=666020 RepID=A0ABN8JNK3_9HYPH|nr:hypothetical protein MES4922_220025 [Mesorhizobium ventifaucium]